ncbi:hypothetical protein ACLQ3K_22095 [Tsukamurella sp. DT100]|uniref:hypothetical protein n=1 Tax=Tsukamurella sp. DT100 TaxID=3393415 RepID=UPI003CE90475
MNKIHRTLAALTLAALLTTPAAAWADPAGAGGGASIDSGSGPRTAGAEHEDGNGVPGPSFDTPVSIPSVGSAPEKPGKDATEEELKAYEKALAEHERQVNARSQAEALEWARIQAKEYRECLARDNENEVC